MKLSELFETNDKAYKIIKKKEKEFDEFCDTHDDYCTGCGYGGRHCFRKFVKDNDCEIEID